MEETPPVLEELEAELGSPPRLHLSHTEINVLQMTDGRLRQEYHALQAQLRAVQQERDDLLVRLKALETTHRNSEQRHKREIEELQRMMSAKEDEIDELKVQVSKLAAENTILKEKAKTNTEKLDQQGNDINYLRAQVEGLLRMIPSTNAKVCPLWLYSHLQKWRTTSWFDLFPMPPPNMSCSPKLPITKLHVGSKCYPTSAVG
eukprot:TRINITY_DN59901_c0_g1_i4.p1 TRINITY_DN59901_c0_g1~~TRINITY_DN59901_c0_g1_i4.p1  ORF type:complete len:204 (+),score=16.11 TRINITY_DN59901_c0_g1_i4:24-635(+)